MFSWQVFGLTGSTYWPDFPGAGTQCPIRRSYLLTAAGQLRIFTGFPFHPVGGPRNENHFILDKRRMQYC